MLKDTTRSTSARTNGRFQRGLLQFADGAFGRGDLIRRSSLDLHADQRPVLERDDIDLAVPGGRAPVAGHHLVSETLEVALRQVLGARAERL